MRHCTVHSLCLSVRPCVCVCLLPSNDMCRSCSSHSVRYGMFGYSNVCLADRRLPPPCLSAFVCTAKVNNLNQELERLRLLDNFISPQTLIGGQLNFLGCPLPAAVMPLNAHRLTSHAQLIHFHSFNKTSYFTRTEHAERMSVHAVAAIFQQNGKTRRRCNIIHVSCVIKYSPINFPHQRQINDYFICNSIATL